MRPRILLPLLIWALPQTAAHAQAGVCRGDASPCSSFSNQILWENCGKQQGCRLESESSPPYRTWCAGTPRSCASFGEDLTACGKQYGCYWFRRVGGDDEVDASEP